jgi:hypothetical protein
LCHSQRLGFGRRGWRDSAAHLVNSAFDTIAMMLPMVMPRSKITRAAPGHFA